MILCVLNSSGKEVTINPVVSTRQDIIEMAGETFTIGGSDYLYHVHEVYAKQSPDTSFMVAVFMFLFAWLVAQSFFLCFVASGAVYLISKVYFYFDKKAVKKFNESKKW